MQTISLDYIVKRGNIQKKIKMYYDLYKQCNKELKVKYNCGNKTVNYYAKIMTKCKHAIDYLSSKLLPSNTYFHKGICYPYYYLPNITNQDNIMPTLIINERWFDRSDWINYLEAQSQVHQVDSKMDNILKNKDLQRYITEYI